MGNEKTTITGLVIPAEWDLAGRIRGVCIAAFDESEYRLEPGGLGDELLPLVHRRVWAQGHMAVNETGARTFRLQAYRVLTDPPEA